MLRRLQHGLEQLYRVETGVAVDDFVIGDSARDAIMPDRAPREQLLVAHDDGGVALALYVDGAALANLERGVDDGNLGDFLLAVEGVSHFVYAIVCARGERNVTALELELQGEVDKYVTCVLTGHDSPGLRRRLFEDFDWEPDLDADERDRYRVANENARTYARSLERRFVASRRVPDMLAELRRFYRLSLGAKLALIASAA